MPATASGMMLNTEEIVNCPQLAHFNFFKEIDHPAAGKALYPGGPFVMSETPWQPGRAPLLGEHNREVYSSLLGFSEDRLNQLGKDGVI